ncbi:MAG: Ni/Fe hydrogenase subunit alpha [Vicinamibacterales bacterium]
MSTTITIEPVSRVEGHAKITIRLDDSGAVQDARFHVLEFRGFETFCEGRHFQEMPAITSRICGICPVSHMLASADAGDRLLAVEIPETALLLRRIVNLAQIVQSHALSFFYLSSPDLLLGYDADPARRNVLGVAAAYPELARRGIRLRQFGQSILEAIAGRRIHASWAVAGGVNAPLSTDARDRILHALPEALDTATSTLEWFRESLASHEDEARIVGHFPTLFLGMVSPDGTLETYGGRLRLIDERGRILADQLDAQAARALIDETVEPWSYLKSPYYKPLGPVAGAYRVGPLARLNVAERCGTPLADRELSRFRALASGPVLSSFHYHYARLIEILHGIERIARLLDDPAILRTDVLAKASRNRLHGVGMSEAPRGTLFHDYTVDENGLLTAVDLLIATGQNNLAMNRTVTQIARACLTGNRLSEGLLNRVEAGIRAFDPCLSCSTHAAGTMPLTIELRGPDGDLLDTLSRPS